MDLKETFMAANLLLLLGTWIVQWVTSRNAASNNDHAHLKERVAKLEAKMPSSDLVHELAAALRGVDEALKGIGQRVNSMQTSVDRVNDYLLNNKG